MDGDNLLINAVTVTTTDVQADNGVIHVIDAVLIPPAARGEPTLNIVDTAVADGNFTTLVATLQATGLDATLADETSTFTVFAPTDDAFAIIDAATIDLLLANTDVLSEILAATCGAGGCQFSHRVHVKWKIGNNARRR